MAIKRSNKAIQYRDKKKKAYKVSDIQRRWVPQRKAKPSASDIELRYSGKLSAQEVLQLIPKATLKEVKSYGPDHIGSFEQHTHLG